MKAKANKCHLPVTRDTDVTAKIGEFDVKNSREENRCQAFFRKFSFFPLQNSKPKVTSTRRSPKFYGSSET